MMVVHRFSSPVSFALGTIALLTIVALYVATPIYSDQTTSIAAAHQADFHGSFPHNVIESWDSRGLLYKITCYAFYRAALLSADFRDKNSFEIAFRTVGAIVALVLLALSALLSKRTLRRYGLGPTETFFVFAVAVFTLSYRCALQAEDIASWVCILGTGCALAPSRALQIAGGILLGAAVGFKGTTGALGAMGLAAVFLLERQDKRRFWTVVISFALGGLALVGGLLLWAPTEIQDLMDMTRLNDSFGASIAFRFKALVVNLLFTWPHIPILLPGVVAAIFCFRRLWQKRETISLLAFAAMWALPATMVFVQGKGFDYHYVGMMPVAAGSVLASLAFLRAAGASKRWEHLVLAAPAALGLTCALINPLCWLNGTRYQPYSTSVFDVRAAAYRVRQEFGGICTRFQLDEQPEILYLDPGNAGYYFGAKSCLRYFYPFPLHRSNPKILGSPLSLDNLDKALRYRGEYIVWNYGWFPCTRPDLQALRDKLDREYAPVYDQNDFRVLRRIE